MRKAALFILTIALALTSNAQDRRLQGRAASQALLDLHFFSGGRGMITPPGLPPYSLKSALGRATVRTLKPILQSNFGLIVEDGSIIGYHEVEFEGRRQGVVGCAMCHTGRAAGRTIPGLGNKNIDIFTLAQAAKKLMPAFPGPQDARSREVRKNAEFFIDAIGNPRLAPKTQGLIPIALIRKWFFDQAAERMDTEIPGQVKIPALWGYGEKRKVGSFSDGFGNGVKPGWAIAVELTAGQSISNVRQYVPRIEAAEDRLAELLPPAYPFAIDSLKAARGKSLFESKCSRCHGTYDRDAAGLPIFETPKVVPWASVGTDHGRLDGVTPRFRELVKANPLNDIIEATENGEGYVANRLDGIWARFPYFHNASIPNLYSVLNPDQRPKFFSLRKAGELERFDSRKLGLNDDPRVGPRELQRAADQRKRWVYDTRLSEHGNGGHDFPFIREFTDVQRFEIIEYLKTL
ncbi:MAG: hypothetical protein V4760_10125 [Bdellovibrionota bacterium]